MATTYKDEVKIVKEKINLLSDISSPAEIEQTANRLEGLNFGPPIISPIHLFLRFNRSTLLGEIDRIVAMPDQEACALAPGDTRKCEDLRLQYMNVLLYYYEKLLLLRQGNAEEWDEVDELYVHD